jgi:hypothetical protein
VLLIPRRSIDSADQVQLGQGVGLLLHFVPSPLGKVERIINVP